MNKNDRRYLRTHAQIRKTFEELILEKELNKITVSELAERANINRKTFYLHYKSLHDVLEDLQKTIMDELTKLEDIKSNPVEPFHPEELMKQFFNILSSNLNLHRRIFSSGSYQFLIEHIRETMIKGYTDPLRKQFSLDRTCAEVFADFISYGTLFVVRDWLMKGKPIQNGELARFLARLIRINIEGLSADAAGSVTPD